MLPLKRVDHIRVAFDDHRLVDDVGLLLPVAPAGRLGLGELVELHVDPGRTNVGDKTLALVASTSKAPTCCVPARRLAPPL